MSSEPSRKQKTDISWIFNVKNSQKSKKANKQEQKQTKMKLFSPSVYVNLISHRFRHLFFPTFAKLSLVTWRETPANNSSWRYKVCAGRGGAGSPDEPRHLGGSPKAPKGEEMGSERTPWQQHHPGTDARHGEHRPRHHRAPRHCFYLCTEAARSPPPLQEEHSPRGFLPWFITSPLGKPCGYVPTNTNLHQSHLLLSKIWWSGQAASNLPTSKAQSKEISINTSRKT